ncbi:MAG: EMC3/TMCO1 family protein [Candidatus Woesearchaeota archaeon]
MAYSNLLDPILNPLLVFGPLWSIIIMSLVISLFITLIYKLFTDQKLMKELKADLKSFQKEMKELKEHPAKVIEVQKKAMEKNMQYMMHSFKPMIITMIPIIVLFGWMHAHLAYEPIMPGTEFTTTAEFAQGTTGEITIINEELEIIGDATQQIAEGKAQWKLKGEKGDYILEYKYNDKSYFMDLEITEERNYKNPIEKIQGSDLKTLKIDNNPLKPLQIFGMKLGWIWTYILFSIIFSMVTRKLLKVY